ncbi:MAG: MBL fold metallo-hydrolase [Candidatus Niyogibacteria bacterium]|nr:MAG: MBL fold metallo-hydrolase [Candidatus Niyogibacteria bacterium]
MRKFFEKYQPRYIFLGSLFLAAAVVWFAVFHFENDRLVVAFLNVGQGDAILINTSGDQQILIDGGPNKQVLAELSKVMPFYDRSIDAIILTHPHQDHVGGLVEVLKRYDVDFVFDSGDGASLAEFAEFNKLIKEKNMKEVKVRRGMRILLGGGAYFDVLLPDVFLDSENQHQNMVVGRLTYGNTCFLLTGDMEREQEFKILNDDIDCDVLKVGHHGSKTSSSESFLKAVSPEIAVIQVGAKNRYGHPYQAVLERLSASVAQVFRTDVSGAVIMESDGRDIIVK